MERERYDGADVLRCAAGPVLDWERLLARSTAIGAILFSHLCSTGSSIRRSAIRFPTG